MESVKIPAAAKYDNGKPMLGLIDPEFLEVALSERTRNSVDNAGAYDRQQRIMEAIVSIGTLAQPLEHKDTAAMSEEWDERIGRAVADLAGIDRIPWMLRQCAVAMGPNGGMKKYNRNNWRLGLGVYRMLDAAMRHLLALFEGEEYDSETTAHHIGCAAFGLMIALVESKGEKGWSEIERMADKELWLCKAE